MQILHGTWIPQSDPHFIQSGSFCLWVETTAPSTQKQHRRNLGQPHHLAAKALATLLSSELGIKLPPNRRGQDFIQPCFFLLPTVKGHPLPSLDLARYLENDLPDSYEFQYWSIDCYHAGAVDPSGTSVVRLLNDLHFMAHHNLTDIQLGADLYFWFHFTQALKRIIFKDHYIPSLKYQALDPPPKTPASRRSRSAKSAKASKTSKALPTSPTDPTQARPAMDPFIIHPGWEFVGEEYEKMLEHYVDHMPLIGAAGFAKPRETLEFYDRATLLRHFSDCLLTELLTHLPMTQVFEKKIQGSLIASCLKSLPWQKSTGLERYMAWQTWRDRIVQTQTLQPFYLYFHLQDPAKPEDLWWLQLQVGSKQDPSLRLALEDYWRMRPKQQKQVRDWLGNDFEQNLLLNLGYAARIYPSLWAGLETDQPVGIHLNLEAAFSFLKESAWVLENAGYKVVVPAWWTPQGQRRARVRLQARGKSLTPSQDKAKSYFSFEKLVDYNYELAIGDAVVSEAEWQQLVNAKSPLVQFRGQWIELDQDKMQQMLTFWQTQQHENPELGLLDFLKLTADSSSDELEVVYEREDALMQMLAHLKDNTHIQLIEDPATFQGKLRDYQKRGVSWLHYLDQMGLNGCLADDMGLGKTVQVIARLVQEREWAQAEKIKIPPTLLIAPTSVVSNWFYEIQKFAPHLKAVIHHGSNRAKQTQDFKRICRVYDILITSFTLARIDVKLFNDVHWHRIVLDEAQNIKNPKAALTKSICKFEATHRLALTGTPIENRLLDLWSIFNFLNPGYLGSQKQFQRNFEIPIQKNHDPHPSATLKQLVEPFILRRVKTDQAIIQDLPDKVEQTLLCNLTKEQASLYEAVVKDVERQLDSAEGIQRQGLILGTLTKLKQVCNHPRQFLQDDSDFTAERSHKLTRLTEMVAEAMEEQESVLIFTQFTELGSALEKYLRQTYHYTTYYLHGGTTRSKREAMIQAFQAPEAEPSIFVLSLKAGGVGITLTNANHVFHFDRWWNPAVEDQATDRAFRIGQKKAVFVHKFVAIGTLEERIDQMIADKKALARSIVGSDESWLTELDNDAFKQLIALNRSAILD